MGRIWKVQALLVLALLLSGSSALAAAAGSVSGGTATGSVFNRTLRQGESGADVKKLQRWLSDVGYNVPATGYFGSITKAAVVKFQTAQGLKPVTGGVGRLTDAYSPWPVTSTTNFPCCGLASGHVR